MPGTARTTHAGALVVLATLVAALLLIAVGSSASAGSRTADDATSPVTIVLFHGDGCPHCAAERDFLAQLAQDYPDVDIEQFEVWYDAGNRALLEQTAARMGFEPTGVPVTVIGDRVWIGFSDEIADEIISAVVADRSAAQQSAPPSSPAGEPQSVDGRTIDVPLVGTVDPSSTSLLVATLAIGFVDGVNPCSLWVLSLLLAMVLSRGSRGRVVLVGTTFLTVTAAMYGLYIIGFYTALDYVGGLAWIRLVVAAVAIAFGVMQLKDGIVPGRGPSLSISPAQRPRLYARMRGVAAPDGRLAATLAGTVMLAVGVSLLETPCTAGLPLLWTGLLADRGVSAATAVALFAVYMSVFLLDELLVFGFAVVTLRGTRLQERHGRALKILAGSVLATLGLSMLVAPAAMDTLGGTAVVFALALTGAALIWVATRSMVRAGDRDRGARG